MYKEMKCKACGGVVTITNGWANSCSDCDTEYNGAGEALAPRGQWGAETGESFGGRPDSSSMTQDEYEAYYDL